MIILKDYVGVLKMNRLSSIIDKAKTTATTLASIASGLWNRVSPILHSIKDTAKSGWKAIQGFASAIQSSVQSTIAGVKSGYLAGKATGNVGKAALYDAPRGVINQYYYQDEKASKSAFNDSSVCLATAHTDASAAFEHAKEMLSSAWDATVSTVDGLVATKDTVYFAADTTLKTLTLAVEGVSLAYEGVKTGYSLLPEMPSNLYLPTYASRSMKISTPETSGIELQPMPKAIALAAAAA